MDDIREINVLIAKLRYTVLSGPLHSSIEAFKHLMRLAATCRNLSEF
jgi:hypothetical protein